MDAFSSSYGQARKRFRQAVQQLGWHLEEFAVDGKTPDDEDLMVDIGLSSPVQDGPTLLVSSGLHGIEGFLGSAAQLLMLDEWRRSQVPHGIRIVFLHALNPYGFAWLRRTDAFNRDLNRNFLIPGETYSGAPPLYSKLDSILNPRRPPSSFDFFMPKLVWNIIRHGFKPVQSAIASGQYDYPEGLFFGGHQPSQLSLLLAPRLERWLGSSRRVLHVDLHTGLGKYGQAVLLLDSPLSARHKEEFVRWFGATSFRDVTDSEGYYQAQGSFGRWCHLQSAVEDYVYCCADFGTYSPIQVARALRAENRCYHWSPADSELARKSKEKLLETFCPASPEWRRCVMHNARELTVRAIEGLLAAR